MFPVGDEAGALGYVEMFTDMLNALERGTKPIEDFYDGYVVNAIMDAALLSARTKRWEPVAIADWRGDTHTESTQRLQEYDKDHYLIKRERMPDGTVKVILKQKAGGKVIEHFEA
jgi:hypothetical protein